MIILKVLENVAQPTFLQKLTVIQSLEKLSSDTQIWIDIFLNYDCDVNATNIFERYAWILLHCYLVYDPIS